MPFFILIILLLAILAWQLCRMLTREGELELWRHLLKSAIRLSLIASGAFWLYASYNEPARLLSAECYTIYDNREEALQYIVESPIKMVNVTKLLGKFIPPRHCILKKVYSQYSLGLTWGPQFRHAVYRVISYEERIKFEILKESEKNKVPNKLKDPELNKPDGGWSNPDSDTEIESDGTILLPEIEG